MTIPSHSLIGMALADELADANDASLDEDGFRDVIDADYQFEQYYRFEDDVREACDVLSVFCEEATRWA